ncbi:MAG: class I mannose-6-phosphate isomerase [Prolixibacteraceae bacterium]|nr:class I mannose-6-phosphate isomerase [Prolixibacteraceae bacterium]
MNKLYPLKFKPQLLEKIWGGEKLGVLLNKDVRPGDKCGESWELSAVEGHLSIVSNGFLKGNDIQELVEIYMGDLVGDRIYDCFGIEFPLLIKFIDAADDLSVQVHPDDELAKKRHNAYGKTEMWYVINADKSAKLNAGFNQPVTREKYLEYFESGNPMDLLNFEDVNPGDVFFIPAGRVHAIGKGIVVAEIQQTSDVTYRIFDYNRIDKDGNPRELHTDLALDALDFTWREGSNKTPYQKELNKTEQLVECKYFTTNIIEFDKPVEKDIEFLDSFVIYMCIDGCFDIVWKEGSETMQKGDTVLVPASFDEYTLKPDGKVKTLEIYIEKTE